MNTFLRRRFWLAAAGAAIAALALAFAGCGSDDNSGQTAGLVAAVQALDGAGLHAIDTSIAGGAIPATAQTTALKMQTVLLVTRWPNGDLKKKAESLAALLGTMANSLNGDNPDKAKAGAAAHDAHEGAHDFSDAVWSYLENKAGVKAPAAAD
jgi:hypothetical protein